MRHNEKSENIARGRRLLVVASQTVGVVAVHRPHRRPNPFVSGQSFHFQMTGALGVTMLIPLSLTVRVLRREQIVTSATRRANREEKNMVKENNEVSRCKTAGALLHRDCWRNRDEAEFWHYWANPGKFRQNYSFSIFHFPFSYSFSAIFWLPNKISPTSGDILTSVKI